MEQETTLQCFVKVYADLLCLSHSNVDVERTFSDVSSIKIKKRNCLKLNTLQASE